MKNARLSYLYFIYYVLCKIDRRSMPNVRKPVFTAAAILTFVLGWMVVGLLGLLNYFTHWLTPFVYLWNALHWPHGRSGSELIVFFIIVSIVDWISYGILFNRKKYDLIMQEFSAYDISDGSFAPVNFLLIPFMPAIFAFIYAHQRPLMGNLIAWSLIIFTEIIFRLWWNSYSKKKVLAPKGR